MTKVNNDAVPRIVIVKLGGSSITDKSKFEELNSSMLHWVASTLSTAKDGRRNVRFIVVHGAGSFGHHTAKQFGLKGHTVPPPVPSSDNSMDSSNNFMDSSNEQCDDKVTSASSAQHTMEGLARTRFSVTKLNLEVVRILLEHNINAVGVSPFSFGLEAFNLEEECTKKELKDDNDVSGRNYKQHTLSPIHTMMNVVENAIKNNLVPVIHGDAVFYGSEGNAGILSGDTIVSILVRHLYRRIRTGTSRLTCSDMKTNNNTPRGGPQSKINIDVFFLTDVDGVYTSDPKGNTLGTTTDGQTHHTTIPDRIPIIEVNQFGTIQPIISSCSQNDNAATETAITAGASQHEHDVTGGLKLKLASAIEIVQETGCPVYIIKCGSKDAEHLIHGKYNSLEKGTRLQRSNI